ncbi:MAG: arginase family protein [Lewinella sp.]|nr:arginase family protein [Lewinella sp.]
MLENWLQPLPPAENPWPANTWGEAVTPYSGKASLKAKQVVLLGLDATVADALREALYPLAWPFSDLRLTDLGNVRKQQPEFVIPLIRELLDSQLFPILIGGKPDMVYAQFQSFLTLRDQVSLVVVDERVPLHPERKRATQDHYLNTILHNRRESLFHLGLIGPQAHFTDPDLFPWLAEQNFEYLRLGKARQDLPEVEPLLRDADLISFHLDALKRSEAPAQLNPSPSGFFLEEAAQLCRYAGMSDKLRSFGFYGIDTASKQRLAATAPVLAQLVWYLTEGYYQRKGDYPANNKGLTEYIVDLKGHDNKLVFWKSNKSGRWWLQVPAKTSRKLARHRLIPCSYEDYKMACQEEVPDRLLNAFKRFP